ncbi:MAG: LemA family protein [Clostridia bacterium]|nr:LemA family protein [Clostridia bacterium]MBQ9993324.1 LemA family protein [Clostridia bacterium]
MNPVVIVVIIVVVLLVLWFISTMNKLIRANATVEEAFSGMDIYLKKRYDLIPNIVATVKGYAAHEKETLVEVINARNAAAGADRSSKEAVAQAESELSAAMNRLMVVVEQYPNLKADAQFLDLQRQLASIETEIAQSRKYYSGAVKQYNLLVEMFPSSIVASLTKHAKAAYFEVSGEHERENVTVDFSK